MRKKKRKKRKEKSQRSRSILLDGSRSLGFFGRKNYKTDLDIFGHSRESLAHVKLLHGKS